MENWWFFNSRFFEIAEILPHWYDQKKVSLEVRTDEWSEMLHNVLRDINEKRPRMVLDRLKLEINNMTWRFDREEDVEYLELSPETSNFILSKVAILDLGESALCLNREKV